MTAVAQALRDIAALPDPVGEIVRGSTLANGLQIRQVRVPLGVVGMIYEARPNVTVDAAGLGLKSGNAVILRGGSAAAETNTATVAVLRSSRSRRRGCPPTPSASSRVATARSGLLTARAWSTCSSRAAAPTSSTRWSPSPRCPSSRPGSATATCTSTARDLDKALAITVNSKTHRPSVCNAAGVTDRPPGRRCRVPPQGSRRTRRRGCHPPPDEPAGAQADVAGVAHDAVTDEHFATEFHGLEMSVGVVDDLDTALEHIRRYGSGHTEAIVTEDRAAARRFTAEVDAAAVMVNASTRFTDGGEFGFGRRSASPQKLHARGRWRSRSSRRPSGSSRATVR